MEQANLPATSLTQRVRECVDAGNFNVAEGSKFVGFYEDGYSLIVQLILIERHHGDHVVRERAQQFMTEVDKRGQIGDLFKAIHRFVGDNKIKFRTKRRNMTKGWWRLSDSERRRLEAMLDRDDVEEEAKSDVKRILAGVVNGKVISTDHNRITGLLLTHSQDKRDRSRNGWRKIENRQHDRIDLQLAALIEREDVTDASKHRARRLLDGMEDGRIRTIDYLEAVELLSVNRASKREIAKRRTATSTFENAVFMACQACDNLTGLTLPVARSRERLRMVTSLTNSVANLLRLQRELLEEVNDDDE